MRHDIAFWLGLLRFPKFGAVRMSKMMNAFPDMEQAFGASREALVAAGIEPFIADGFLAERPTIDPARELARAQAAGLRIVTRADGDYPPALLTLFDPPAVLFVRGRLPDPAATLLAVVGSRHATPYGLECTRGLCVPAARAGVGVVSGLAYGIDAAAHEAALEAGGYTLAVLGGGADEESVYPTAHRALASRIVGAGGAVLSEYLPGTASLKPHFPVRNRIIAGLCRATLVVEATEQSGSLITAKAALDAGRDVFAVPGPIASPLSSGPHALLKNGALCATSAADILEALALEPSAVSAPAYEPLDAEEARVWRALSASPRHVDELVDATGLPAPRVSSLLSRLELGGHARDAGGLYYVRA